MSTEVQTVVAQVLSLPTAAQEQVFAALIASLDTEASSNRTDQNAIDEAWSKEIARRIDEVRTGQADLVDGDTALAEIQAKYSV